MVSDQHQIGVDGVSVIALALPPGIVFRDHDFARYKWPMRWSGARFRKNRMNAPYKEGSLFSAYAAMAIVPGAYLNGIWSAKWVCIFHLAS